MRPLDILVLVVFLGLIPATIAARKGHQFIAWWIFGMILLIVALPAALMIGDVRAKCPACREPVKQDATVCPHCQSSIEALPAGESRGPFSHIKPL